MMSLEVTFWRFHKNTCMEKFYVKRVGYTSKKDNLALTYLSVSLQVFVDEWFAGEMI